MNKSAMWFNEFKGHSHSIGFGGDASGRNGSFGATIKLPDPKDEPDPQRSAFIDQVLKRIVP